MGGAKGDTGIEPLCTGVQATQRKCVHIKSWEILNITRLEQEAPRHTKQSVSFKLTKSGVTAW